MPCLSPAAVFGPGVLMELVRGSVSFPLMGSEMDVCVH